MGGLVRTQCMHMHTKVCMYECMYVGKYTHPGTQCRLCALLVQFSLVQFSHTQGQGEHRAAVQVVRSFSLVQFSLVQSYPGTGRASRCSAKCAWSLSLSRCLTRNIYIYIYIYICIYVYMYIYAYICIKVCVEFVPIPLPETNSGKSVPKCNYSTKYCTW